MSFRVALTTTSNRFGDLAQLLADIQTELVPLPCIKVEPRPQGVESFKAALKQAEAVLITSARSLEWVDVSSIAVPVLAVGEATATAIRSTGGSVSMAGSGGIGELAQAAASLLKGKSVLIAGATNRMKTNVASLQGVGVDVSAVELYTTVAIAPDDSPVDGVVFGSPSAVTGWLKSRRLDGLLVGAVGQLTKQALLDVGVTPQVVPLQPSLEFTVRGLTELHSKRIAV